MPKSIVEVAYLGSFTHKAVASVGRARDRLREGGRCLADRPGGGGECRGASQHRKNGPPHVRKEAFKISRQGRLTTAARAGASAAMLLRFKKEIIEAARRADKAITNVVANETWAELKILVPYVRHHPNGLADLRDQMEAENVGLVAVWC